MWIDWSRFGLRVATVPEILVDIFDTFRDYHSDPKVQKEPSSLCSCRSRQQAGEQSR